MKQVSEKKFFKMVKDEEERAKKLAMENQIEREDWWFTRNENTFRMNPVSVPCMYKADENEDNEVVCPITRTKHRVRPIGKTMNFRVKRKVTILRHAADTTCINLNRRSMVRCYAEVEGKFYVHKHKVGSCPWKER